MFKKQQVSDPVIRQSEIHLGREKSRHDLCLETSVQMNAAQTQNPGGTVLRHFQGNGDRMFLSRTEPGCEHPVLILGNPDFAELDFPGG